MAKLKDVAELACVPMAVAFQALSEPDGVDAEVEQRVAQAAARLNYALKITQIDIADLAGVAKGTVSYALNGSDLVKPETRQKVLDAAQALGYSMNITARNLRTNRAGVVGYSWHVADDPGRMNYLLDRFIYRVTAAAEARSYHLLTFIQPQTDADRVYESLIATTRVDGFIISDVAYDDPRIQRLSKMRAPFAAFGGMFVPDADFAYVDVDGRQGTALVVEHLLAQGHERIGLLTRPPGLPFGDAREAGYRGAMEQAGLRVEDDWIAYTPNILYEASAAAHQVLSAQHKPTALICTHDMMTLGAKSYLDEMRLSVPEDIALAGYDDDPTSEFLGITSVRQPIDEVARTLFDILLGEINHAPLPARQVTFTPELVVRASTLFPR